MALVALVFAVTSAALPRVEFHVRGSHAPGIAAVQQRAFDLAGDTVDDAESHHAVVLVQFLPDDPVPSTAQLVRIASDDGKPRGPAAFPLATPRRGPPRA